MCYLYACVCVWVVVLVCYNVCVFCVRVGSSCFCLVSEVFFFAVIVVFVSNAGGYCLLFVHVSVCGCFPCV